jgi:hypothetical protein
VFPDTSLDANCSMCSDSFLQYGRCTDSIADPTPIMHDPWMSRPSMRTALVSYAVCGYQSNDTDLYRLPCQNSKSHKSCYFTAYENLKACKLLQQLVA